MIRDRKLFLRRRKKDEIRALGMILHHLGLSLRETRRIVRSYGKVSHEAIRQWYHRLGSIDSNVERKERKVLAIDETKVKVKGRYEYLWAVIDVCTREILVVYLSSTRTAFEAMSVVKKALKACSNRPVVLVDNGPWYVWALQRLGVERVHRTFGERNAIEQWFGIMKRRTRRFYNSFNNCRSLESPRRWMRAFMNAYNLLRSLT